MIYETKSELLLMDILQTLHNNLILYLPLPTVHKAVASNREYLPNVPCVHTYGWWIPTIVLRIHYNKVIFVFSV